MKQLLFIALIAVAPTIINAQIQFNTGSSDLDADLNIINSDAKKDITSFKADLSVSFGVSVKKIDYMSSLKMEPGEIYLALEIAKISKRSVDDVIECYKNNKSKGWGYIAKEMGIKPGSAEFHQLKGKSKDKKEKGNSGKSHQDNSSKGKGNGKGNGKGKK